MLNTTLTFSVFDWAILLIYLGFVVWIGVYLKRFTKTDQDFFLAGRRNSPKGGLWGLLIGIGFSVILFALQGAGIVSTHALIPVQSSTAHASVMAANFWRAWWAWLIAAGIAILVSMITEKKSEAELEGYIKGTVVEGSSFEQQLPWYQKTAFWASVAFVLFAIINIYFW